MPGYRSGAAPANKGLTWPPEPLSRSEIEALLPQLGTCAFGARNRALVGLLWRSGLRISEALALFPKDIDRDHGTVTVLRGKGRKRRQVAIDMLVLGLLDEWWPHRERLGIDGAEYLFCSIKRPMRGGPLHSSYVREMMHQAGRRAEIQKRVHPHGLRHTMAFELLMEGMPLGVIRDQLGHTQLQTTMTYLDHLAPAAAIKAMHARPVPTLGGAGLV